LLGDDSIDHFGNRHIVLVNAPVASENPAHRGGRVATDMQAAVQSLFDIWCTRDYAMGFGVGIAIGPATVGTVGNEGRIDYTAIGIVVNLASQLCRGADDTQMPVDAVVAKRVKHSIAPVSLGERTIKGYDHPLQVFAVERSEVAIRYPDCLDGACRD
jgi:adenylate cyclase